MSRVNGKVNLTKRLVEELPVPKKKRTVVHDSQVRGLGVMVTPGGCKSYFWFRKVDSQPTWRTLGQHPELRVELARDKARILNGRIANWKLRDYEGPSPLELERSGQPTLQGALDRYASDVTPNAATWARYSLERYCGHLLGRKLSTIRPEHVQSLHAKVGEEHGHYAANRLCQALRAVIFHAMQKAKTFAGPNPCTGLAWFHEEPRQRALQPQEAAGFFAALRKEHNVDVRDFVWLALCSGARRGNILAMRWDEIALEQSGLVWRIPAAKAKGGREMRIPLVDEVAEILKRRKKMTGGSAWVFPSTHARKSKSGHLEAVHGWKKFRKRIGLNDLRVHDLRRSLGSWMAGASVPILTVSRALGHSNVSVTSKVYTPLAVEPIKAGIEAAVAAMAVAAKRRPRPASKLLEVGRA